MTIQMASPVVSKPRHRARPPSFNQLSFTQHHSDHIMACDLPQFFVTSALSLPPLQLCHVIARVLSTFRFSNLTMTQPVSSGFQAFCHLSEDPPLRQIAPPPPSTISTLLPFNQPLLPSIETPPPLLQILPLNQRSSSLSLSTPPLFTITLPPPPPPSIFPPSTPPPSNVINVHQPSNVINAHEALPSFLQTIRAQLIRRPWPSGRQGPQSLACLVLTVYHPGTRGMDNSCKIPAPNSTQLFQVNKNNSKFEQHF